MPAKITFKQYQLWCLFRQVHDLSSWYEDSVFARRKITYQQFLVLWSLKCLKEFNDAPVTIKDLLPLLYHSHNGISQIINRMVKNGLVKKLRDLPDQRAVRVSITPKGEEIFNDASNLSLGLMEEVLSVYPDEEVETLLLLVEKLKKRLTVKLRLEPDKSELADSRMAQYFDRLSKEL